MKPNEIVWFCGPKYSHGWATVSTVYNDMQPPSLALEKGGHRMVVRQSECKPKAIHEAESLEELRDKYTPIIEAWEAGMRTVKDIAAHMGLESPSGVWPQLNCALKHGLIKE